MKSKKRLHFSITTNIFISFLSLTLVMIGFLWSLEAIFFNKVNENYRQDIKELSTNHRNEMDKVTEAINNNTIVVQKLIDKLDKEGD